MRSYRKPIHRTSWARSGMIALVMALLFGGIAQGAPQYVVTCDYCHNMPPLDSSGTRDATTGAFKGNHQKHANTTASSCAKCHGDAVLTYGSDHRGETIQVQGNINGSPAGGAYSRTFFNQTSVPPNPLGTCSNINCHFESVTPSWGSASFSSPVDCNRCHGSAPSTGNHPVAGSKHGNYYGTGTGSCGRCHPDHSAEAEPFMHATSAGHRGIVVGFTTPNSGGAYSGNGLNFLPSQNKTIFGNCTNLYCHSNGAGGVPNTVAAWGGALDCRGCHNSNLAGGAPMASGRHPAHVNNATLGSNYGCVECHAKTVTGDTVIGNFGNHVNTFVDYSGVNAGKSSTYSGGTCSATYCHTSGKKGGAGMAATVEPANPSWSGAALDCKGCHGAQPLPTAGVAFNSVAGEPNYVGGAAGAVNANSHQKHVKSDGATTCVYCHSATTADGTTIAGSHTNRTIDVVQGGSKTFGYPGSKTCSNVSCHSGGGIVSPVANAQWGATLDCNGCHGGPAALGANILASGKHTAHVNQPGVIGDNFGCAECHAKTVSSDTTVSDATRHMNAFLDYSGVRAGKSTTYSGGTCSATYCHTSGKKGQVVATVEPANPSWSGAAMVCSGCHGAQLTPTAGVAFNSVGGEPNYVSGGAGAADANSHQKHVGTGGAATCAYCHSKTTANGTSIIAGSQHLDKFVNYTAGNGKTFGKLANKTCSNISCHSGNGIIAGVGNAQWGATLDCNGCHGGPAALGTNILTTGRHTAHVDNATLGTSYGCVECHAKTVASDTAIADPIKHGNAFVDYSGVRAGKSSTYSGGTCSATYCHTSGKKGQAGMVATVEPANPSWSGAALLCSGCHGAQPFGTSGVAFNSVAGEPNYTNGGAGATNANSHQKHVKTDGATTCGFCHSSTTTDGTTIAGNHTNRFFDVVQGGGKTFGYPGAKTCSNVSCHSSGGLFTAANAQWGASLDCKGCHATLSGAHTRHMGSLTWAALPFYNYTANNSSGADTDGVTWRSYSFGCANCHPVSLAKHIDGYIDVELNSVSGGSTLRNRNSSAAVVGSVGSGTERCSNVYCHKNTTTPQWNLTFTAATRCGGCHENAPSTDSHAVHLAGIHYDSVYSGTSGMLPSSGAVGVNAGHGDPAQSTTISCNLCHVNTVSYARNKYNPACSNASCHGNATGNNADSLGAARIANLAKHANGSKEVAFAAVTMKSKAQLRAASFVNYTAGTGGWVSTGRNYKTGTSGYDTAKNPLTSGSYSSGNCSNISCHNGKTVNWTTDFGSARDCIICHEKL